MDKPLPTIASPPAPAADRDRDRNIPPGSVRRQGWLAAGSVMGALAASSCCIAPLVLFSLGATGAWIGSLAALSSYQPVFLVATAGLLAAGFVMVYRTRTSAGCPDDGLCARPTSMRAIKSALWASAALTATAFAFPYVAPVLLGI